MGKTKFEIKFNPEARKEFVTGFKKRKDERRKKAQEKVKQEVKDKRKEILHERKKHRERIEEQYQQVKMLKKQEQEEIEGEEVLIPFSYILNIGGNPHSVGNQFAFLSPPNQEGGNKEAFAGKPPMNMSLAQQAATQQQLLSSQLQNNHLKKKPGDRGLAEMVRTSIKQTNPQQKPSNEFIKGTQVTKDFQLVAEPLAPKLQHNNSSNLKVSSYTTTTNTGEQSNSQNSSRKNLDSYYTNGQKQGQSELQQLQQQLLQNQALSHLTLQNNNPPHYSTNRSVAAKAGQMQIFSTDKYSHLSSNNSTQNTKFMSPSKPPTQKMHQSSASQQIENIVDLQMKIRNNNSSSGGPHMKYTDYLNRFSTHSSIDTGPGQHSFQMKYRDLKNQMTAGDNEGYSLQHAETVSGHEMSNLIEQPVFNVQGNSYQQQFKRSPVVQKENKAQEGIGLGISGEQMHLEEKSFLKKLIGNENNNNNNNNGNQSQRHAGSSRKRQDQLSVHAKGLNRGFRVGIDSQPLAMQPRTRYDYVFIRISEDHFQKEFADKIFFSRDSNEQSPSQLSFKSKRIATNSVQREEQQKYIQQTPQLQLTKNQKSLRGSQEFLKENSLLSPMNQFKSGQIGGGMEDLISIQNLQPDTKIMSSPKQPQPFSPSICSIISTNHTHIKVITHQGMLSTFAELTTEQAIQQQNALNDCVQDVMAKVQEKGRVVKTTQKKKYIINALNAPHMRIASIFVIVLDNNTVTSCIDPSDMRQTLMSESSTTSSNFNSTLTKLQTSKALQKGVIKKDSNNGIRNQDQINAKLMRMRNNSTINSKGYESESEVKSTNSTTTSSTLQQFIPTRNFDQGNGGSNTTKNSSRSLSQKGTQPRKNFQKQSSQGQQNDEIAFIVQKDGKKYPPTKIKILSPFDLTHYETHRINVCLNNYNNFIQLCFKQKGKINVPAVLKLAKQLGMPINSNYFNDGAIKSREQANMIKEKLIAYLCKVINDENQPENMPENQMVQDAITPLNQPIHQYKCFVGKGNNSILIRTLFKTRFWWLLHDKEEIEKVNFMWTQLRKNQIMDTFPCKFEDKKSGLRQGGSSSNQQAIQTPGKLKQKKKMQLQNSTQSLGDNLTGSNDKKESKTENQGQPPLSQTQQQLCVKLYNKLEDNFHLSNKKAMFLNIRLYYEAMNKDVFNAVPMTFHVKEGLDDPEFLRFKAYYLKEEDEIKKQRAIKKEQQQALDQSQEDSQPTAPQSIKRNIWIVKPGENTNRGQGITVLKEFDEIKAIIQESTANRKRTCIVQKYIHNPLLINKRKFDIRLYAFMSSVNGNMKGYFYSDGYLRTSCREFTLSNLSNRMIHLTNDAVQKHAEDYGKYEAGNKLSYTDFQNYLDKNYADLNICFERDLLPQMKKLVTDTFRAVYGKLDPKRRINTLEIYGYDFMFDDDFKVYLIEVNTNPCLELGCPLLARLIPTMVENALRLVVDPLFPAPENWSQKKCVVNDVCPENKFELIFDEKVDGPYLTELMKEKNNIIIEIDEEELSDDDVYAEKDECELP